MRTRKARILVVEDEPDLARLISSRLEAEGWDVVAVADGQEALREIQDLQQDLVVLDVMLPGMSGWEVCRLVRLHPDRRIAQTPILMLTARNAPSERVWGLRLGANDYLGKPFTFGELALRIDRLLEHRRRALRYERLRASLPDLVRIAQQESTPNETVAGKNGEGERAFGSEPGGAS